VLFHSLGALPFSLKAAPSHHIWRGLRFAAVLCPMRLPAGHGDQNLGPRLCMHKKP
jgi:hypothetical protein